jgi:hypothetical protein
MTVRMRLPYGQKIETAERMENVASVSKRLSWTRGNKVDLPAATAQCNASGAPWQRVNFLPEPHGHGSLRPGAGRSWSCRSFVVNNSSVWARPVGVAVAHDGALLVSEDGNGTIWRVSYRGGS